jgi:hypothetical protein
LTAPLDPEDDGNISQTILGICKNVAPGLKAQPEAERSMATETALQLSLPLQLTDPERRERTIGAKAN